MILGDIQAIYDTSHDVLRPFSVIEKFAHIMELLPENMDTQNRNVENYKFSLLYSFGVIP